jgi:hypothetical protein
MQCIDVFGIRDCSIGKGDSGDDVIERKKNGRIPDDPLLAEHLSWAEAWTKSVLCP